MITNFNGDSRKDDVKFLTRVIVGFLFVVWLCTPPGNKFLQICFWGNNTQLAIAKLTRKAETTEYIYHRKNAIYYTKINNKRKAIESINKAISTIPSYVGDEKIQKLYRDRALINIYFKEFNTALTDLLKIENLNLMDNLRVAMLLKKKGQLNMALSYCNNILNLGASNYAVYSCMADVYAAAGYFSSSVKIFDYFIENSSQRGIYYVERAYYKDKMGDIVGANADRDKAQELQVNPNNVQFIVNKVLDSSSIDFES